MDNHNIASADTDFTQFERSSNRVTKRSRRTPRASPRTKRVLHSPRISIRKTKRYLQLPSSPGRVKFTKDNMYPKVQIL